MASYTQRFYFVSLCAKRLWSFLMDRHFLWILKLLGMPKPSVQWLVSQKLPKEIETFGEIPDAVQKLNAILSIYSIALLSVYSISVQYKYTNIINWRVERQAHKNTVY